MQQRYLSAVIIAFALAACDTPVAPSTTQKLGIASGQFGIVDRAEVISIDFIRFDENATRYSNAASALALELLNNRDSSVSDFVEEFAGEVSRQLADEVEQEIRARNCIYVVRPTSRRITSIVVDDAGDRTITIEDELFDLATEDELKYLDSLSDNDFEIEFERLVVKYSSQPTNISEDIEEFAVASQCLLNVRRGDVVTLVKFEDLIAISPALNSDSYAAAR